MLHISIPNESSSGSSYKTIYTPVLQLLKVYFELLDYDSLGIATCSVVVPFIKQLCITDVFHFYFCANIATLRDNSGKMYEVTLPVPVLEGPCDFFPTVF
jgi:hypothetical protein